MKGILVSILMTVAGLAVAVGLAELSLRLFSGPSQAEWNDRPPFYFKAEESSTLQDYSHSPEKAPNTFRIAVVGDSFTFAPYMQFTDAFPKQLERMLNLNKMGLKAEVINYGVPAYSTNHEVPKVREAIAQQADLVILQITLNDPEIKGETPIGITDFSRFAPLEFSGFQKKLANHSRLYRFVRQRFHNQKTVNDYEQYFTSLWTSPHTMKNFRNSLTRIAEVARQANTKLVAVIFPLFGLPLDQNYPFWPIHETVANELAQRQVLYVDLSPFYKGIPLERLQVIPGVDRHPNEIGHRIAAEQIYMWLESNGFLPDDLKIRERFTGRTKIVKEKPYQRK